MNSLTPFIHHALPDRPGPSSAPEANCSRCSPPLGKEPEVAGIVPVLLGVLFVWIGNYLPKLRRNSTLGVKVSWTLGNEENWNRTHRFAGKLWVGGGLLLLLGALLPLRAMVWVMICVTAALGIAPIAYSYAIFRQHRKAGVARPSPPSHCRTTSACTTSWQA